jgi:NAD(P)-dependent dehydrogenase (short-subunit alcohol dehydrogenase family)
LAVKQNPNSPKINFDVSNAILNFSLISFKVIGLARRIEELACSLADQPGALFPISCDVTKEDNILEAFKWVVENVGPVHILINNAGLTKLTNLTGESLISKTPTQRVPSRWQHRDVARSVRR